MALDYRKCAQEIADNIGGGVSGLDTSKVKNMSAMFYDCSKLASLDLSGFDTSNVKNMVGMFNGCSELASLDLSGFDTSNVKNMVGMFQDCSKLASLDLSGFDTSKVTVMRSMFYGCSKLASLDVSGFDTSKVTDMSRMFRYCSKLSSLDLSGFDTSKVTDMRWMFDGCSSLGRLATGSGWKQPHMEYGYQTRFPVKMADEAGAWHRAGAVVPDGARVYTAGRAVTSVSLSKSSSAYTGKAQRPAVKSVKAGTRVLKGSDYTVSYRDSKGKKISALAIKGAGTYKVVVTGKGNYAGSKSATFEIKQATNSVSVKGSGVKKSLSADALKKKAANVPLPKATAKFGKAKWVTATKDKKKVLSLTGGKVKVKKGAKKGAYAIKLKASVAKTANFKGASSKTITVKVTVK